MKVCGICLHPERSEIDAKLIDGVSLRAIAGQFGTTKSALDRHRKHIPTALAQAKQAEEVAEATTLLSRVEQLVSRCEKIYEKAMKAGELTGAVGATREMRSCLELLGKLSGELKPAGVNVQNTNIQAAFQGFTLENFTNGELEFLLERVVDGRCPIPETVKRAPLFDDATVPPPANIDIWRRNDESLAHVDALAGKPPRDWCPHRDATASDRFQMLLAAWKRETGRDLDASISLKDLGSVARIQIEFDLAEGKDRYWESWPQVQLIAEGKFKDSGARPALPARTIQGVR